jgi:protein tyrosine phosphatase
MSGETSTESPEPSPKTVRSSRAQTMFSKSGKIKSTTPPVPPRETKPRELTETKKINHFWYQTWPDHGVPTDLEEARKFITYVYNKIRETNGTTVIHCSAGVGRTGTIYIILKLIFDKLQSQSLSGIEYTNMKITDENIKSIFLQTRKDRDITVQTEEQYKFIYDIFGIKEKDLEYYNNIDFYIKKNKLRNNYNKITQKYGENCKGKNRYDNILPYNNNRVKLSLGQNDECSDYINASRMTPFNESHNVIATQCPLTSTIGDFKRMLKQEKVKNIIMVTGLIESDKGIKKVKCSDYTNDKTLTKFETEYTNQNIHTILELTNEGIKLA